MFNFRVVPAPKQRKQENKLFSGVFNNAESCLKRAAGVLEYKERALNKLQMRKELRHTVGLIVAVSCWLRARNTMILYNREGKDLEQGKNRVGEKTEYGNKLKMRIELRHAVQLIVAVSCWPSGKKHNDT